MTDLPPHSPPPHPPGPPFPPGPLGPPDPLGPPEPPAAGPPRRRIGRPLVITGVVALVVGVGAGVAAAVTGSSSPSPSASSPAVSSPAPTASPPHRLLPPGLGGRGFAFGGLGGPSFAFGAGPLRAVHGEFVVPKQGGGYETVDVQRGQVTAVSGSAITIKSSDGFTRSYVVTSSTIVGAKRDGIGSIKAGDQAAVTATVSGGTATAVSIVDLSNLQGLRQGFFRQIPLPSAG